MGIGLVLVVVGLVLVLGDGDGDGGAATAASDATTAPTTLAPATTATPTTAVPTTSLAPTTTMPAPTTSLAPTTTVDPTTVVVPFFDELSAALRAGDDAFLYATLHPLVFERYAEADCRAYLAGLVVPAYVVQATAVGPPETWEWETDGVVRAIPGATPVTTRTAPDGANFSDGEAHVVLEDGGTVRWFTDCGTPKEGAR